MKVQRHHYLLLHMVVFLWGFTGILGKLITLPTAALIWYRLLIIIVSLVAYMLITKISFWKVKRNELLKILATGTIVVTHWLLFYESIKQSNASITLACFSTGALFVAFIEPILFKRKLDYKELFFGSIVIAALLLIFKVETKYTWGIVLGILAAFTSGLFGTINGLLVKKNEGIIITFYEIVAGFILLSFYFLFRGEFNSSFFTVSSADMLYVILLGTVCAAFPMVISVNLLKYISPYTVSLTLNLETVYGIIMAALFLGESNELSVQFYLGTLLILATVFVNAWLKSMKKV